MKKKAIMFFLSMTLTACIFTGCTKSVDEQDGLANTNKIDSAIKNASATEDSTDMYIPEWDL